MTFQLPDPDVGRCNNYRPFPGNYGLSRSVRCNGYDSVEHVCWFTAPPAPVQTHVGSYLTTPPKPKPWIEPECAGVVAVTQKGKTQ